MPLDGRTKRAAINVGALGTPLPLGEKERKRKFRELIHECYTEEEWMRRFMKLSPLDQFKFRVALEPKESQLTGKDGESLNIQVVKFADALEAQEAAQKEAEEKQLLS